MRSASFCLVKGQETQLSSKQEVKIAEDVLLLSTLKPGRASALSQLHAETQSIQKTSRRLDYSWVRREMSTVMKTKGKASLLMVCRVWLRSAFSSARCWAGLKLQHVTRDHGSVHKIFRTGMLHLTVNQPCCICSLYELISAVPVYFYH